MSDPAFVSDLATVGAKNRRIDQLEKENAELRESNQILIQAHINWEMKWREAMSQLRECELALAGSADMEAM